VRKWRRPRFEADEQTFSRADDAEAEQSWRRRVAEAARSAAEDLADVDDPLSRRLYADLRALEARMTSAGADPPEAGDPGGAAD
jgi:hypothetical protein